LAIAARKVGYAPVKAMDFDGEAVRIAKENARKNGARISVARGDVRKLASQSAEKFEVICANLMADLLVSERQRIVARLAADGALVVAGILRREFEEVRRAYEGEGLRCVKCGVGGEWRSGIFERGIESGKSTYAM